MRLVSKGQCVDVRAMFGHWIKKGLRELKAGWTL